MRRVLFDPLYDVMASKAKGTLAFSSSSDLQVLIIRGSMAAPGIGREKGWREKIDTERASDPS